MRKHSPYPPNVAGKFARDERRSVAPSHPRKKTLLAVDDDPQIRESLHKMLRAEGYEVVLAADGPEGLAKFNPEKIDLVLLDLSLPGKGGWDVFERITFINPLLPVIIITGRENQYDTAVAAGAGALMQKPLDVSFLLRTIAELLVEPPETRLERLAGQHDSLRHAHSRPKP